LLAGHADVLGPICRLDQKMLHTQKRGPAWRR